ncbi:50S ribosomal protein L21 [Aquimarina agarivorans]|uniref:50S ribosomal protein L21 n=1 Tax=Aquimarina agarivorans TaxID=980584 RepID=UPI000248FD66|nr:50S ribosomal protein L21 [Aquimarina agarivorans]
MYAIVEIAGQQFKVAKDQKVFVHRLAGNEGDTVTFDNVLLAAEGEQITVGAPAIEGAQVGAKISRHLKGDKVIVFKKKRRKGYRKKNGHRQSLTEIVIESIVVSGAKPVKKDEAPKKAAAKKSAAKKTAKGDDLKKIEGIGPKAAEALVNAGIDTFAKLAKADPANIKEILVAASSRLAHLEPGTWPQQSQLAADGNWDELKVLQDKLDGGK